MKTRNYENYEDYIKHQSSKDSQTDRYTKQSGPEWQLRLDGFKNEFSKLSNYLTPEKKCLVLGAAAGEKVIALRELGIESVVGLDLIPHEPLVLKGDMHNLEYENDSFDFVYTNSLDHSIMPEKLISEVERVLSPGGLFYLQIPLGLEKDDFTEFVVHNPIYDVLPLFEKSYCVLMRPLPAGVNFADTNFELVFMKDADLTNIYETYGNLHTVEVPTEYQQIWDTVNLPTQKQKLDSSNIMDESRRNNILTTLSRRGYYLTRFAEQYGVKNIAEVGTAQGWQFYSFAEYVNTVGGTVTTCDIRDVRNETYKKKYQDQDNISFVTGTSSEMSEKIEDVGLFYIDGSHDQGAVITDVANLNNQQSENPIWVFDDFDTRFGCFNDIYQLVSAGLPFKVYHVGETGSGAPSHQAIVKGQFNIQLREE
jgi:ubiquinone/menaquinone biosynthesis C-methylase UbiE